jgi:hypothetical protein
MLVLLDAAHIVFAAYQRRLVFFFHQSCKRDNRKQDTIDPETPKITEAKTPLTSKDSIIPTEKRNWCQQFYGLGAASPLAGFFEKFQTKLRRKYLAML